MFFRSSGSASTSFREPRLLASRSGKLTPAAALRHRPRSANVAPRRYPAEPHAFRTSHGRTLRRLTAVSAYSSLIARSNPLHRRLVGIRRRRHRFAGGRCAQFLFALALFFLLLLFGEISLAFRECIVGFGQLTILFRGCEGKTLTSMTLRRKSADS